MIKRIYILVIGPIVLLFLLLLFFFAGRWLAKEDKIYYGVDATVILMGSIEDRARQVVDLYYGNNINRKILIAETGVNGKIYDAFFEEYIPSNSFHTRDILVENGIPSDSIYILGMRASSTIDEAEIICSYLARDLNISSIVLVSSAEHLRRASIIFTHALKRKGLEEVEVLCSPSKYSNFDPKYWWRTKNNVERLGYEYIKILRYYLFNWHE